MDLYGDVEVYLNSFLNPVFDMGDWAALVLSTLFVGKYFSFSFLLTLSGARGDAVG
jgi:hypothetical protein